MRDSPQQRTFTAHQFGPACRSIPLLTEPNIVTSEQYLSHGYVMAQAEKRLMFAVLLDAVECFKKFAPLRPSRSHRFFKDAEEWIFENNHEWPFSFINICEAVGINPRHVRGDLNEWKRKMIPQGRARSSHAVSNGHKRRRTNLPRPLESSKI